MAITAAAIPAATTVRTALGARLTASRYAGSDGDGRGGHRGPDPHGEPCGRHQVDRVVVETGCPADERGHDEDPRVFGRVVRGRGTAAAAKAGPSTCSRLERPGRWCHVAAWLPRITSHLHQPAGAQIAERAAKTRRRCAARRDAIEADARGGHQPELLVHLERQEHRADGDPGEADDERLRQEGHVVLAGAREPPRGADATGPREREDRDEQDEGRRSPLGGQLEVGVVRHLALADDEVAARDAARLHEIARRLGHEVADAHTGHRMRVGHPNGDRPERGPVGCVAVVQVRRGPGICAPDARISTPAAPTTRTGTAQRHQCRPSIMATRAAAISEIDPPREPVITRPRRVTAPPARSSRNGPGSSAPGPASAARAPARRRARRRARSRHRRCRPTCRPVSRFR